MHNAITIAGCDVGKTHLDVVRDANHYRRFNNTAAGHQALITWLCHAGQPVRVVVEASGIYSLDLALALHDAEHVAVMLANPRALKDYRHSRMRRSKTDKIDAEIICDYATRMPFVPWQPPEREVLELLPPSTGGNRLPGASRPWSCSAHKSGIGCMLHARLRLLVLLSSMTSKSIAEVSSASGI